MDLAPHMQLICGIRAITNTVIAKSEAAANDVRYWHARKLTAQ